jgi:hypothetical protein
MTLKSPGLSGRPLSSLRVISDERKSRGCAKVTARSGGCGNMSYLRRRNDHYPYQADPVQHGPGAFFARMQEMRLHQNTDDQIDLKISGLPGPSRSDRPFVPRCRKAGCFKSIRRWYRTGILTVRRQCSEPSAIVGFHAKELKMAFGRRLPIDKEAPPTNKRLCPTCRGTGRVRERSQTVVCKRCKGTGKELPGQEPVRFHPFS